MKNARNVTPSGQMKWRFVRTDGNVLMITGQEPTVVFQNIAPTPTLKQGVSGKIVYEELKSSTFITD